MSQSLRNKLGILVLVLVALTALSFSRGTSKAKGQNIGKVVKGDLVQRVTIAGSVNPNRKTVISAPYSGYVRNLYVKIGQRVNAGDPVVSIAQSLRGTNEDIFPLRAPFAGTVVQILKNEGEYVDQQSGKNSLLRIDDLTHIFVEANSPEVEVGKLSPGQETIVKASAILSRSYKGKIKHISLAAKEQSDWDKSRVEFPVLIEISDQDAQLKPGMSVIVDIISHKVEQVLTLRHEFIQKNGEKYFVVTNKGDRVEIEVGLQNEEAFEVKGGVKEGDEIRQTDFLSNLSKQ